MKHVKTKNRVVREVSDKHTMNIRVLFSLVFLIVITFTVSAQTAVWQWAVPVRNFAKQPKNPDAKAYLWIPEKCKHVKAVLVAQHNMEEISIMEDENFRIKMAELAFGTVIGIIVVGTKIIIVFIQIISQTLTNFLNALPVIFFLF